MMQKIEYTCDRCRRPTPAERMYKLRIERVFVMPRDPSTDDLLRNTRAETRDLCDACAESVIEHLEPRRQ